VRAALSESRTRAPDSRWTVCQKSERKDRCAMCGAWWKERFVYPYPTGLEIFEGYQRRFWSTFSLCVECLRRANNRESFSIMFTWDCEPPPGPPQPKDLVSYSRLPGCC
jgi:hypothetical protein